MAKATSKWFARALWPAVALGALCTVIAAVAPAGAQTAQPDYHPSLGDLMTMAVQPRHTKLALAGRARNWPYAAYEASELRNAFNRIARTIPRYRDADLASMVASNMTGELDRLDAAIKLRDGRRFDAAYADVTHACDTCHQGLGHAEVVIKVPQASMFPDQEFGLALPPRHNARRR